MTDGDQPVEYREEHIRRALWKDERVGELRIDVSIKGEAVHLRGSVPTRDRRAAAEEVVASMAPGLIIKNELEVALEGGTEQAEEL